MDTKKGLKAYKDQGCVILSSICYCLLDVVLSITLALSLRMASLNIVLVA